MQPKLMHTFVLSFIFMSLCSGLSPGNDVGGLIIDNGDPYTSFTGTWGVSTATGAYGVDSLWARGGATYTWRPQQLDPGEYEVFMWWTQLSSRTDAAPVTIVHSAGTTDLVVNQRINGGQWNSLGTYHFPGYMDGTGSVTITALGAYPVSTCADAVRFVRATVPPPAITIIDNTDTALTSRVGTWSVSGAPDPYVTDFLHCRKPNCSFSWHFTPTQTGYHGVYMWWTQFASRSTAAPVEIQTADGPVNLIVDQQVLGGQWNWLGDHLLNAGTTYKVTIRTLADNSTVCADAVCFTPPTETIIFSDGVAHEINSKSLAHYVLNDGPSSQPTILDVTASGQVGEPPLLNTITLNEHSILNLSGRAEGGVIANDSSQVNIYAGSFCRNLDVNHNSTVDMSGGFVYGGQDIYGLHQVSISEQSKMTLDDGEIQGWVTVRNASTFIMNGGKITTIENQISGLLSLADSANGVINGGAIDSIQMFNDTHAVINGGTIQLLEHFSIPAMVIKGGNLVELRHGAADYPVGDVEIYGSAFNLPFGEVAATSGTITGTLENGDSMNMAFTRTSAAKIILINSAPPPPVETIINNTDTALTSRVGTWSVSGGANSYGTNSLYCRKPNCSFSWHFTPVADGRYYVYMWWTEFSSRSTAVPVEIETAGGTQYLTVNQRGDGGQWNLLGNDDYAFNAGTTYKITVRTLADNTTVCADAVRFAPANAEIIYDDGQTHEIDSPVPYAYRVFDGPAGQPTTLNVTESGQVGTADGFYDARLMTCIVDVHDHSILNIWGRLFWGFRATDEAVVKMYSGYSYAFNVSGNSRLDIYGGEVITGLPWGKDFATMAGNSQVYLHDGSINTLSTGDTSRFVMNGGSIREFEGGGGSGYIQAYGQSRIEINAGSVDEIEAGGQSQIEINGGSVGSLVCLDDAQAQICRGSVTGLGAYSTGTVTIKGGDVQNLTVGGFDSAVATVEIYGTAFGLPFGEVAALSGNITGTLENGDPLNVAFTRDPASKIILIESAVPPTNNIIIDNGETGTSYTGTWGVSGATGAYGTDSLWARGGATYTWQTPLPAGHYEVFMWWTQYASRTDAAPVAVVHADGTENLTINQRTNGGQWNSLGKYYFDGTGSVMIKALGAYPVSTCADAVRFTKCTVPPPAEVLIDNTDTATQRVGTWTVSGGADPYGRDSLYCRDANRSFTWLFTPAEGGTYDVSMWWTEFVSRSTVTPVEIQHAEGTAFMTVNQKTNGGMWNILGRYRFEAGVPYKITIRTLADRSAVCADAVKFLIISN